MRVLLHRCSCLRDAECGDQTNKPVEQLISQSVDQSRSQGRRVRFGLCLDFDVHVCRIDCVYIFACVCVCVVTTTGELVKWLQIWLVQRAMCGRVRKRQASERASKRVARER